MEKHGNKKQWQIHHLLGSFVGPSTNPARACRQSTQWQDAKWGWGSKLTHRQRYNQHLATKSRSTLKHSEAQTLWVLHGSKGFQRVSHQFWVVSWKLDSVFPGHASKLLQGISNEGDFLTEKRASKSSSDTCYMPYVKLLLQYIDSCCCWHLPARFQISVKQRVAHFSTAPRLFSRWNIWHRKWSRKVHCKSKCFLCGTKVEATPNLCCQLIFVAYHLLNKHGHSIFNMNIIYCIKFSHLDDFPYPC